MSDKQVKQIRNQIRNIVREMLPEILQEEVFQALNTANEQRIKVIEEQVKGTMKEMNERQRDTMSYLVRNVSSPVKPE